MIAPRHLLVSLFIPFCMLAFLLTACEDSVVTILESDQNFTIYATLDLDQDTQFVRVIPIRPNLIPDPNAPLDVTVRSIDLDTQESIVWRDSVIAFRNGTVGHVFYTPLRVQNGHTYRLEVQSPHEEVITYAETTVPEVPVPTVLPEAIQGGGLGDVIARGNQRIKWSGLNQEPFRVEHWYRFFRDERMPFQDVMLPYTPLNTFENREITYTLDLFKDRTTLDTLVQTIFITPLLGVGMKITVLDGAFIPPGGTFDPEVLVQPGTMSNVVNGFGFVGSVGRFSVAWIWSDDTTHRLKYVTLEDVFGASAPAIRERIQQDTAPAYACFGHHPCLQ